MNTLWRKILGDLRSSKARTLLVVLSIAVGVFAIGMITGTRSILMREMMATFASSNPGNATIDTTLFDPALLDQIRSLPDVDVVEGRSRLFVRVPVGEDQYRNLTLFTIWDYAGMEINKIQPEAGTWPPESGQVLIERASLSYLESDIGNMIQIETSSGLLQETLVSGTAYDTYQLPSALGGAAYGYISPETAALLGNDTSKINQIHLSLTDNAATIEEIRVVANQVRNIIEQNGSRINSTYIVTADTHPVGGIVSAVMLVLTLIGVIILLLSALLVVNTISALLTQQVRQIGVMKAVGGTSSLLNGLYLRFVFILTLLALLIGIPLGILGARSLSQVMASLINIDIVDGSIPLSALAAQLFVGLVIPFLAALIPIRNGTKITVREAINDYGIDGSGAGSIFERALQKASFISRPIQIALRNTFRQKKRLLFTLIALVIASATAISVLSTRTGLLNTVTRATNFFQDDAGFTLDKNYPVTEFLNIVEATEGVTAAEAWVFETTRVVRPDMTESQDIAVWAVPPNTQALDASSSLADGRWLNETDTNSVVINPYFYSAQENVKVGDQVQFVLQGVPTTWTVVGLLQSIPNAINPSPYVYVPYGYYAEAAGLSGLSNRLQIITEQHDAQTQSQVASAVENNLKQAGVNVNFIITGTDLETAFESSFNIAILLLVLMALIMAIVGGLGLTGAMSLNVLERTREIGIMRSIGATNKSISRIVVAEGLFIGALSWVLGLIVAIPLGLLLSNVLGQAFIRAGLDYTFATGGALLWLVVMLILAGLSSYLPARRASKTTIRETLAYE